MGALGTVNRLALLALVAVLIAPMAAGLVVGQEANATETNTATATPTVTAAPTATPNATATPTPVPPPADAGPYSIDELRTGGTAVENAPDSTRMLPNGEFIYLRKWPVGITSTGWDYMGSGDEYHGDKVTFLVVHNGKAEPIEATIVVTYWQPRTRQVRTEQGIITEEYAGNQSVQKKDITIDPGYDINNVTLTSHYQDTYRVTAWLEIGGEPVEGARWRFDHQSNKASSAVPFGSQWSDYLAWFTPRFLVGGAAAVISGIAFAYRYVTRAGVSSEKGIMFWAFVSTIALGAAAIGWWQQVVALVVGAPILLNVPMFALAFVVSAGYFDSSSTARIEAPHITDVRDPMGERKPTIASERGATYRYIEHGGGIGIIKKGSGSSSIASSIARYFTGPATIPSDEWKTAFSYDGPEDTKIYVDNAPGDDAKCPSCPNLLTIPQDPASSVHCEACGWRGTGDDLRRDIISFTPARWSWGPPDFVYSGSGDERSLAPYPLVLLVGALALFGGLGYGIASQIFVSEAAVMTVAIGFVGVASLFTAASPRSPSAWLNASPAHASHAKAARLVEIEERKTWDTFTELADHIADLEVEGLDEALTLVEAYRTKVEERISSVFEVDRSEVRSALDPPQEAVADD